MLHRLCLAPSEVSLRDNHVYENERPEPGRYVLIGGPGQGKTTVSQFLCQILRASLLKEKAQLDRDTKWAIASIMRQSEECGLDTTGAKRFPIRIDLAQFAKALATSCTNSILAHVQNLISGRTNYHVEASDIREWLCNYPWLVIFDGLDEVPASSNRSELMNAVRDFLVDISL
jgi:predicted NACHT family NTPase